MFHCGISHRRLTETGTAILTDGPPGVHRRVVAGSPGVHARSGVRWGRDDLADLPLPPSDAIPAELDALVGEWLTLPDVAERLDVIVTRVHSLIKDRRLIAVRRPDPAVRAVPALFLTDHALLEPLRGTITLLDDAGYSDEEALRWLFTADESLPGRPIDALRDGHKTEVRRRAQALAW